jgi:hypothetical protein
MMNPKSALLRAMVLTFGLVAGSLHAQVPNLLNYQGKLTNATGSAASGSFSMTFSIYSSATAGTPLWTETQNVTVTNGIFNVLLGSFTTFPDTLFIGTGVRYLGIKVGTDAEMTPRFQFTSAAFAIRAGKADKVADNAIGSNHIVDGAVTSNDIADGTISSNDIADNTISSIDISDGGVSSNDIADNTISSNDIADNTISSNDIANGGVASIDIAVGGVTGSNIADNTIASIDIANNAISSIDIADSTISNIDISLGAGISGTKINPNFGTQRILTIGDTGIGTTTPQAKLDVNGNAIIRDSIELMTTGATPYIDFSNNATDFDARIILAGDDKLAIEGTNVGIGTTNPTAKFEVNGDILSGDDISTKGDIHTQGNIFGNGNIFTGGNDRGFWIDSTGSFRYGIWRDPVNNNVHLRAGDLSSRITINRTTGNVGIGTTDPQFKLHVNGSVAGIGAYNNLSDLRYKKNIATIPNALDKITRLRGVSFDWRQDEFPKLNFNKGGNLGFIAQEIKEVLPEVVSQDSQGYYSVAYSSVVPVLVEAIKEQQNTIQVQAEELAQTKAVLENLQERMRRLEVLLAKTDRSLAVTGQ